MSKNKQPSVPLVRSGQESSKVEKGKKSKPKIHNNLVKDYLKRPEIFADFVSGIFKDKMIITPDMLGDADTTYEMNDEIVDGNTRICITKELIRDVAKNVTDKNGNQCLVCIEDQSRYDKNMPIRVSMYDSLSLNSLASKKFIPTLTLVCNWDKKPFPNPTTLSSLVNSPFLKVFGEYMLKLLLAVFNVVEYIYNQEKYSFRTELRTVFAYVSGALNKLTMEEIIEKCPWIVGEKVSKQGARIVFQYMHIDIEVEELDEEENDMVSIYQQKINDEKEKARVDALAEGRAEGRTEGGIDKTYELALSLSKLYNRTFESMLDDFKVTPEVRKICMERYSKVVG